MQLKDRKKFFHRSIKNTSKTGEPVRIEKREPVILLAYFYDMLRKGEYFYLEDIDNPDLKDWLSELLQKRSCFTVSNSRLRIWRKQLYCGNHKRLDSVLKYLYSGTTLAIMFHVCYHTEFQRFEFAHIMDKFYKSDLMLLKKWLYDLYQIDVKVNFDKYASLFISNDGALELLDIALSDIQDISNPYMKNELLKIREAL